MTRVVAVCAGVVVAAAGWGLGSAVVEESTAWCPDGSFDYAFDLAEGATFTQAQAAQAIVGSGGPIDADVRADAIAQLMRVDIAPGDSATVQVEGAIFQIYRRQGSYFPGSGHICQENVS